MQKQWTVASLAGTCGHEFVGVCGLTHFWATVSVNGFIILTAVLRNQVGPRRFGPHPAFGYRTPSDLTIAQRRAIQSHTVSTAAFQRGVSLLQFMLHDFQQTALTIWAEHELEHLRHLLKQHETEEARMRKELAHRMPGITEAPLPSDFENRGALAVRNIIEYLQQHYGEPLHLKGIAATLGMNASYVSDLFSRSTGLRFQDYLNELRLGKAKALLADPQKSVKEIAHSVGYSDPNSFRQAFKSKTGLAPAVWRLSA